MQDFHIRSITHQELVIPLQWAEQEGWKPGIDDANHYYPVDPQGFFMGFWDGEPVGCISGVAYDHSYGFIGFYIVQPEFRHQGFGIALWHRAMEYLQGKHQERNIGLDGVIAQQSNYQKSGFKIAYRHLRFQTLGTGGISKNPNLVSLSELPLSQVLACDIFPVPRPKFWQSWIKQKYGTALGIIQNQELVAHGVIRACHGGFRIGSLCADSPELAARLLESLLAYAPAGSLVFIDMPEINQAAMVLAKSYGMSLVFETTRMYTQSPPIMPVHKIYGVTTLELG
ncbi:acetyltransferase [Synechococcus sp. PCC 7502]|uniref:GNAT family N-acetyltransferase n=1 Tax=Synechococcus sp. PCC 7502 TaxID=1173263 RepID=UPI00029FDFE8|nr:GNAT family N-acetyltransferase [Synechococcus sp. PCC 7502]AFY74199.1 acetyltransferase [Synechococcus sp. PCC 7502]